MRFADAGQENCSLARPLTVLGERWTLLVLREAFLGVRRFDQMQRNLGIASNVLSKRLDGLVAHGILERVAYHDGRTRYEYRLTPKGVDLYPVIAAIQAWGDAYMVDGSGPPVINVHKGCGRPTRPTLCCSECGEALTARDVRPLPGPGAPAARLAE